VTVDQVNSFIVRHFRVKLNQFNLLVICFRVAVQSHFFGNLLLRLLKSQKISLFLHVFLGTLVIGSNWFVKCSNGLFKVSVSLSQSRREFWCLRLSIISSPVLATCEDLGFLQLNFLFESFRCVDTSKVLIHSLGLIVWLPIHLF
jgi:hypothetical protein